MKKGCGWIALFGRGKNKNKVTIEKNVLK